MYKSRSRRWKRKPRRRPWYFYAALLVGIPIGLELLVRLASDVTGLGQTLSAQESEQAKRVATYELGFQSPTGQPYAHLAGQLQAVRDPLMGYRLRPDQRSDYWTINSQGFREDKPVPLQKAANEVRIFVLGGSMAFGNFSSSNEATLASQLEALLNNRVKTQQTNPNRFQPAVLPYTAEEVDKVLQRSSRIPERQYRVVNAAVPGYASGNDLALLLQQIAAYSPDIVIVLNSHEELLLPSAYSGADVPGLDDLLTGDRPTQISPGDRIKDWASQLYTVRGVNYLLQLPQTQEQAVAASLPVEPLDKMPADSAELEARVSRYQNNLAQMVRWSSASRKRLLIGIQPELAGRNLDQLPPQEQTLLAQLGDSYRQQMQAAHPKLAAAAKQTTQATANARLLDLYDLYAKSDQPAFQGPNSLTDEAYKTLADQFYQAIVEQLAITPKPFGS